GALSFYWLIHGNYSEGRDWLDQALAALAGAGTPAAAQMGDAGVKVLFGAGFAAYMLADYAAARRHLERCVRLGREIGENGWAWRALGVQAVATLHDPALARSLAQEALELARRTGDPWAEGFALMGLGAVATLIGDHAEGRRYLEESVRLARQVGDRY